MTTLDKLRKAESHQFKAGLFNVQEFLKPKANFLGTNQQSVKKLEFDKTKQHVLLKNSSSGLHSPRFFTDSSVQIDNKDYGEVGAVVVCVTTTPISYQIPFDAKEYPIKENIATVHPNVAVSLCLGNIEQFWHLLEGGANPLEMLNDRLLKETKRYFASLELDDLIDPTALFKVRQKSILKQASQKAAKELKALLKSVQVDGLALVDINIAVDIQSDQIAKQIEEMQKEYGVDEEKIEQIRKTEGKLLQRRYIDSLLDQDMTFAPHNLRQTIMLFDPLLVEQFYTGDWSDAMKSLYQRIIDARKQLQQANSIRLLRNWIQIARESGVREDELSKMRSTLVEQITSSSGELLSKLPLYEEFFQTTGGVTETITPLPALPALETTATA